MSAILDKIFLTLLTLLLLATPFAIGSTPPPAYSAMEVGIFALVVVWMLKLILISREQRARSSESDKFEIRNPKFEIFSGALPLLLFLGLVVFQLTPIPPWARSEE